MADLMGHSDNRHSNKQLGGYYNLQLTIRIYSIFTCRPKFRNDVSPVFKLHNHITSKYCTVW